MKRRTLIALWVFAVLTAYFLIAFIVFGFRHPWMTDTQRLLFTHRALMFDTVDPTEVR